jgi:broad specificity phosphatase PhoE
LIRHAPVVPDPARPPDQWLLSETSEALVAALASLPAAARVERFFSSPEPKALGTARIVAGARPIEAEPGLRELDRSTAGWLDTPDGYASLVAEILCAPERSIRGCEPAAEAQRRMVNAVERIVAGHRDRNVAIVSHGIALTLYLSALRGLALPDLDLWRRMRLPDLALVDPERRLVLEDFGTWQSRSARW